jgi:hypothetical protein
MDEATEGLLSARAESDLLYLKGAELRIVITS